MILKSRLTEIWFPDIFLFPNVFLLDFWKRQFLS